mmetsp:Transcript_29892/g.94222  ORF Transcript_29892/g.94222 Transcript_29892/m.94222 type:complete len:289 (+) Transcript_29892:196-1062(+)
MHIMQAHNEGMLRAGLQSSRRRPPPRLWGVTTLWLHVVFALLLIKLALLLGRGVLVLLVLGDEVVHVALGFCKLHLVHPLARVPVEEGLAAKHRGEVLSHALEHLLDCRRVPCKGHGHLEAFGGNVAHGGLDVVGDPLHEVGTVLVLHIEHLLVHLLGGHTAAEKRRGGEVAAVPGVRGAHHVLRVEHLLRELRDRQRAVLLRAAGGERRKARHKEVQAWEGYQVHRDLSKVTIELSGEAEARGHSAHGRAHEMVQVPVRGRRELQGAEADVVEGLVVKQETLICILY